MPVIELTFVTSELTPRVITSKKYSTVNNNSLQIKTVYHTQRNIHLYQVGDKDEAMPVNINSIRGNITGLHEVTPLNIKIIRVNIKGLRPYLRIYKSNRDNNH